MPATTTRKDLVSRIRQDFEHAYRFKRSRVFTWAASENTIYYSTAKSASENPVWSLLHELGHAELGHRTYHDDLELLIMEVAAWQKAKHLAEEYHLVIEDEHIDECLSSYRNWLHQRSRCVECKMHALQIDRTTYECYNCLTKWQVPTSRMCVVRKRRLT
jgi:hypothetical protein